VDGSLNMDLILRKSDAKPERVELFRKAIPGWFSYLDKGGDIKNIKHLANGLKNILAWWTA
jgi:hypothetical protein